MKGEVTCCDVLKVICSAKLFLSDLRVALVTQKQSKINFTDPKAGNSSVTVAEGLEQKVHLYHLFVRNETLNTF